MLKTLILPSVLFLLTVGLQAQQYPSGQPSDKSSGQTKVEGCLQGTAGNFTLTDSSGVAYQLQGDTTKLTEHVGHEVQITGSTSGASATSTSSAASSSGGASQPTLEIKSVKHISKTCKSASK